MSTIIKSIEWEEPVENGQPLEGDLVRFVPFKPDPVKSIQIEGRLLLDQDTSSGNRRWTIEYESEVASDLIARCYSNNGELVLLGCYPKTTPSVH